MAEIVQHLPQGLVPVTGQAQQAIVPAQPADLADMFVTIRELNELGQAVVYKVPLPSSPAFSDWSLFQQVAMLKAGSWSKTPVPMIVFAIAYANKLGLDIMQGDVYTTGEGRIATSNKAKIKMALATGKILGYEVQFTDTEDPGPAECVLDHDILCTISLTIKGMEKPIIKTQSLCEWFVAKNSNWKTRPRHMLEINTFAHACEMINPTATEDDERPPMATPTNVSAGATDAEFVDSLPKIG